MFVMRHKANSMIASNLTKTSKQEDVWFVDSGATNHMTAHEVWFRDLRKLERPDYVETGEKCRQCPIWGRRQSNLHQERFACTYNNKERGLSWPDCRTRHASSLQWWRMQCKIYQFGLPLYTIVTPNTMGIKIPLGYMICSFGRGLYYQQKSLETWLEVIFARMTRVRPNAIVIDKS